MSLLQTTLVRYALASSFVVALVKRIVPPLDRFLLRLSCGWVSVAMQSIVLLETTGARSGQRRRTATLCLPLGKNLALAGSNWGQTRNPAWIHNLRHNPKVRVWFRGYCGLMSAREMEGVERREIWRQMIEYNPQYALYQERVERDIPVFLLTREPGQ